MLPTAIVDFPPRRLAFGAPREVIVARTFDEVVPAVRRAERLAIEGAWVVGMLAYEAAPAFDGALVVQEPDATLPLAWFAVHDAPLDRENIDAGDPTAIAPQAWNADTTRAEWDGDIAAIRAAIARGDVYQVNHTLRLTTAWRGDAAEALAWYERLRRAQRSARDTWCAFVDTGDHAILSASPELFVRRDGRTLVTRPMKGTALRGSWPGEDARIAAALAASPKERAENVMIVDLLRNDLGRVAETGSVRVTALCEVERYRTVWQMTSTIEATLREECALADVLAALFPCGSVTGAPKVTAMRTIAATERGPRGPYCGAVGVIRPGGDFAFNVPIRTVWLDRARGVATYGTGGGITWDSTPAGEYDEAVAKAALLGAMTPVPMLLETMRLDADGYVRRERHLARLARSAEHFATPVAMDAVGAALDAHARAHHASLAAGEVRRARLLVAPDGDPTVESAPLVPALARPRVALARTPVSRTDPTLYHKTTSRATYDARRAEHPHAWDVLLTNEAGEVTEFTIGNVVLELDGARVTPPVPSGLLGGVLREELLERGEVAERVLRVDDLERATRVWLVNSARGWVEVELPGAGSREP
jgi:para-aminobenzoate synthetase / 4-amino-4-deoxychorismate lyase